MRASQLQVALLHLMLYEGKKWKMWSCPQTLPLACPANGEARENESAPGAPVGLIKAC